MNVVFIFGYFISHGIVLCGSAVSILIGRENLENLHVTIDNIDLKCPCILTCSFEESLLVSLLLSKILMYDAAVCVILCHLCNSVYNVAN